MDSETLTYAPQPGQRFLRSRTISFIAALLLLTVGGALSYHYRVWTAQEWTRQMFLRAQRRCLAHVDVPGTVAYEQDASAADRLLKSKSPRYVKMGDAACLTAPEWDDFYRRADQWGTMFYWSNADGATLLLHEMHTPGGPPLIVRVVLVPQGHRYPDAEFLHARAWSLGDGSYFHQVAGAGGLGDGFFGIRGNQQQPHLSDKWMNADHRSLRVFAGRVQADNPARAGIPFEFDGLKGVVGISIRDDPQHPGRVEFQFESTEIPPSR